MSITLEDTPDITFAQATSPNYLQDGLRFAGRASDLHRSEDKGRSWHFAYDSLNPEEALATTAVAISPDFMFDQTVFAGAPGGTLRSTDASITWNVAMLPSPPPITSGSGDLPKLQTGQRGVTGHTRRWRLSLSRSGESLGALELRLTQLKRECNVHLV